jgi:hypothetical protein
MILLLIKYSPPDTSLHMHLHEFLHIHFNILFLMQVQCIGRCIAICIRSYVYKNDTKVSAGAGI